MAAWKIFGHDTTPEQLPAELRTILAEMQRERVAFERLVNGARDSAQNLGQIAQPIADAQKTVAEVQSRVKSLERLVPVLATLDEQTEAVSRSQRRTETQIESAAGDAKQLRAEIDALRTALENALALKNDLAGFLELGGGFKSLRLDADKLTAELRDITQGFDRARERQDEVRRASEASATRLHAFEERQQQAQGQVTATESRVAAVERTLGELTQAASDAAQTRRQLGALKTMADQVGQKVSALELQRDVVERALSQLGRLDDLMREIDAKIQRHEEHAKGLGELESRVAELKVLHTEAVERSEEIARGHEQVRRADDELKGRLATLRDEVQRSVKRFELENQGLDAVSQRIVDLRGGLSDLELRFRSLDEASKTIGDVRARADGLVNQLEGVTESIGQLETQAERVNGVAAAAGRLGESVDDMTQRVAKLEQAQPNVAAALQDVASLKGTHEAVKGALEQVQLAESEMARVREGQAATKAWLASATESVQGLRGELAAVEELKPVVEHVRGEAERVSQAQAQLESRGRVVEDLGTRLSELVMVSGQLDERSRGLVGRMDGADERFKTLAAHAEEAARIEQLVPAAVAAVERAERRAAEVDGSVAALAARAQNLEGLAERTRALGQELEARQAALDKASEQLDRVSQVREQAAATAQQLEERAGALTTGVATAGGKLRELAGTLDEIDNRLGTMRFAQKRMAQFEERLSKWEAIELRLTGALEQVTRRQATLDGIQADMQRVFEVSERTVDGVRTIAAAKDEVSQTRAMLENVLALVGHVHDAANGLEHRKRQVEQAEERLGRVEALMADMRSSLESLNGQKALLDQVMERAEALAIGTRQAEGLIERLRAERDVTDKVRVAMADLREKRDVA